MENSSFVAILKDIKFIERYKFLSKKFSYNINDSFENYSTNTVTEIIEKLGYLAKYNRKEGFYKIIEKIENYKFQFNIILKYGIVELVWSVWMNESLLQIGGPWSMIKYFIDNNEDDRVRLPVFRNYNDLEEILKETFSIYEDFKQEVLKIEDKQ